MILLVGGCFALSSHLSAQQPTFRARTDLVQVDVVVVDKDGNHVRGLKREDFQLFDRRKPRPISAFDEVQHAAPGEPGATPVFPPTLRMDVASNTDPQADRLVVMVIDDLHIFKGRTTAARELAHKFLDRMGARASMAVLKTSGERSTEITQDRALLTAAIDNFAGMQSWRRPHQARDNQTVWIDANAPLDTALKQVDVAQKTDLHDFFDNMTLYKSLRDAARMLATESVRRKAFVMITEGLGKDYVGRFDTNLTDCEMRGTRCYHDHELRIMMESLRRSGVAVYNVDPRGKVEPGELALEVFPDISSGLGDDPGADPFSWNNVVRLAQNGLRLMSEASGGFAITDNDDFDHGLDRIVEDLDHFYLLGFNPVDAEGSTGFRALDVRVPAHPEWTLRFRKGYLVNDIKPKSKTPLAALAEGVMSKSDLPLRLNGIPRADRVTMALEVTLPKASVSDDGGRLRDSLKYSVYAVDLKAKKIAAQFTNTAELSSGPMIPPGDEIAFVIPVEMRLKPGSYQLRASVTSARVDKGGSVYLALDVPDWSKTPLAIGGLLVGRAGASEVALASTKVVLPFTPAVDRTFTAAELIQVDFEVISKPSSAPAIARVEVVNAGGDAVRSSAPVLPVNGRVTMPVATVGLAPGAYILRAVVTQGEQTATRETGFIVK